MISDYLAFFSELPNSFKEIGSVIPSSPFLVNKLLTALPPPTSGRRILEVGPGTGVLTKKILENLTSADEFVLYEINECFAQYLSKMLAEKNGTARNVKLVNADIRSLGQNPEENKFDVIFSGLPFTNFDPDLVEEIANLLKDNLKQGGTLAFFGYLALPKIRQIYSSPKEKKRLKEVVSRLEKFKAQATNTRIEKVFLNIPPAHGTILNFS